jgi:uncharacterized metal-binding protein YceD (DUF177 family)
MAEAMESGAEFPRLVDCARLGRSVETHTIEADEDECRALADRLGLLSLNGLNAGVVLSRTTDGLVRLKARFKARCTQSCVVTLRAVHQDIDEEFELFYSEKASLNGIGALQVTVEDELWPEPLEQGRVDIGEAVSQQLALALDPYPRAPGAVYEATAGRAVGAERASPLAEIGKLMPSGRREDGG